jgi:hypothetical protein
MPTTYRQAPAYKYERAIATFVAVWVIGLISYLILSNRPFDEPRIYFLKILLSLSIAIIVATIPRLYRGQLQFSGPKFEGDGRCCCFCFCLSCGSQPSKFESSTSSCKN